jgi:hypothetical protein
LVSGALRTCPSARSTRNRAGLFGSLEINNPSVSFRCEAPGSPLRQPIMSVDNRYPNDNRPNCSCQAVVAASSVTRSECASLNS